MRGRPDSSGGPVAIRGYLVQALIALLEIAQAKPPFADITFEPPGADDQFDFVWRNATKTCAVQVKSTTNEFTKPLVEKWAQDLERPRTNEECRLILVGNYHTALQGIHTVCAVAIEKKNLDLKGLVYQAAHMLDVFMDAHNLDGNTAEQRIVIAESLVTTLQVYSTTRRAAHS